MSLTIAPLNPDVNSSSFISYRRLWLDTCLEYYKPAMRGVVIDLGGKAIQKRGSFQPPEDPATSWFYVNIAPEIKPNVLADVTAVPMQNDCADCILCNEVLEHLKNPADCVQEVRRLLHKGGIAFISVPFLYPIHADPYDFQRYSADGLQHLFRDFSSVEITPMGGFPGVVGMFLEIGLAGITGQRMQHKLLRRGIRALSRGLYTYDLSHPTQPEAWQKFTTGYFLKVIK